MKRYALLIFMALNFALPANASILELNGRTFAFAGPNCFGVAMFANQNIRTIRGVDLLEFSSFIESQCIEVQTPQNGDIGTFHNTKDFIHAFIQLEDNQVLEKTGVDYLGKTPIQVRDISHTIYTFEASPECRRYGGGSKDCYNKLRYFRCNKGLAQSTQELQGLEESIELLFERVLSQGELSKEILIQLEQLIVQYESAIDKSHLNKSDFYIGRLLSFEKQLLFLKS